MYYNSMEKHTNKKKIAMVAVLAMAIIGIPAMAMLVTYLSNTVTSEVSVESPLELQVSNGYGWEDGPVTISSVVGGETFTYYLQVNNLNSQAEINTNITTIITNNGWNVKCTDFTEMIVNVTKNTHNSGNVGTAIDVISLCTDTGGEATVKIPSNYQAGETEEYKIDVTFAVAVNPDTYLINTIAKV